MKCDRCGREIDELEENIYEQEIYAEESPESEFIGIKKICEDCFNELECLWCGF